MSDTSRYEILDSLPSYGPMYIPISECNKSFYSEGFVVRFYTSIHTNWVGNFEPGCSGFNAVYDFGPELYVLVIAGGICYLMNPDDHEPISIFGVHCQMVIKGLDGKLILNESTYITVFETSGEHWSTERISYDGLVDLKLEGNLLTGLSFAPGYEDGEWLEFAVDLETRVVKGGSFSHDELPSQLPAVLSISQKQEEKKEWWKISGYSLMSMISSIRIYFLGR